MEEGDILGGCIIRDEDGAFASHAFEYTLDIAHLWIIILIFITLFKHTL